MPNTRWEPGEWKAVCDICGFDFKSSELLENWKGQRVCVKDFETRHPQEFVRAKEEKIAVPWTRPSEDDSLATITADPVYTAAQFLASIKLFSADATSGAFAFTVPASTTLTFSQRQDDYVFSVSNVGTANAVSIKPTAPDSLVGTAQFPVDSSGGDAIPVGATRRYRFIPRMKIILREQ